MWRRDIIRPARLENLCDENDLMLIWLWTEGKTPKKSAKKLVDTTADLVLNAIDWSEIAMRHYPAKLNHVGSNQII